MLRAATTMTDQPRRANRPMTTAGRRTVLAAGALAIARGATALRRQGTRCRAGSDELPDMSIRIV